MLRLFASGLVVMVVFGAVRSTSHVKDAGVGSYPPERLLARTRKVWVIAVSAVRFLGLVQAAHPPASSLHSKVAVPTKSGLLKVKAAVVKLVGLAGRLLVISVSGSAVFVQVNVSGVASTLPAGSFARTSNVCEPSSSA